ncbi:MAG: DUF882 domain-containing protein [Fretibacterium sp.]|nr:DUF882 domain-containing protein [Fretibacterium sp.]
MGDLTKNFSRSEFACKCGCGKNNLDRRVVEACQTIRDAMGQPISVNSGVRCEKNNAAAGGAANSYHIQGLAADLSCKSGALGLYLCILNLCDKGKLPDVHYVIWYQKKNFVHIDLGKIRNNRFAVK